VTTGGPPTTGGDQGLRAAFFALVASIATLLAVSVRAAEEHRGLDLADLRSVVLVAVTVSAAAWLRRG
jgi:hypothetical protein